MKRTIIVVGLLIMIVSIGLTTIFIHHKTDTIQNGHVDTKHRTVKVCHNIDGHAIYDTIEVNNIPAGEHCISSKLVDEYGNIVSEKSVVIIADEDIYVSDTSVGHLPYPIWMLH